MNSTNATNKKPIPRSMFIFGAAGHIGTPLVEFLHREAPDMKLRLCSKEIPVEDLAAKFPYAEAVEADYFDLPSLEKAFDGMEGIFVVTPTGTDEQTAMTNVVAAAKKAGTAVHIIRILGMVPMFNPYQIPESIRKAGIAQVIQHPIAKDILDKSGLPVTYLNLGATMIDNIWKMKPRMMKDRTMVWQNRLLSFIDPRDIAEVAGRLFLSDDARHIYQFHTLNNGQDMMRYSDVADIISEVTGETIKFDGTYESFAETYPYFGPRAPMVWEMFELEGQWEVAWARNEFVERTLGRRPITVRDWVEEHKDALLK